jgi:hypothetical protein
LSIVCLFVFCVCAQRDSSSCRLTFVVQGHTQRQLPHPCPACASAPSRRCVLSFFQLPTSGVATVTPPEVCIGKESRLPRTRATAPHKHPLACRGLASPRSTSTANMPCFKNLPPNNNPPNTIFAHHTHTQLHTSSSRQAHQEHPPPLLLTLPLLLTDFASRSISGPPVLPLSLIYKYGHSLSPHTPSAPSFLPSFTGGPGGRKQDLLRVSLYILPASCPRWGPCLS